MERKTAEKAAKWWADQLRGNAKLDNGDDSQTGGMAMMMTTILQAEEKSKRPAGAADKFEAALTDALCEKDDGRFWFGCDYSPDFFLSSVAKKAGVNLGRSSLPWKTSMWIEGGTVKVACGYGAAAVEL